MIGTVVDFASGGHEVNCCPRDMRAFTVCRLVDMLGLKAYVQEIRPKFTAKLEVSSYFPRPRCVSPSARKASHCEMTKVSAPVTEQDGIAQSFQNPLLKACSVNYSRIPGKI